MSNYIRQIKVNMANEPLKVEQPLRERILQAVLVIFRVHGLLD